MGCEAMAEGDGVNEIPIDLSRIAFLADETLAEWQARFCRERNIPLTEEDKAYFASEDVRWYPRAAKQEAERIKR